jgi:hypothetical protein
MGWKQSRESTESAERPEIYLGCRYSEVDRQRTDRAFNPVYVDQEGRPVKGLALSHASSGRASPVVEPAVHVAEVEFGGNGSFADKFGYYFLGASTGVSGSIQFYAGRDAFRYLLAGELAGSTKFSGKRRLDQEFACTG